MIEVAPLRFGPLKTLEDVIKELRRVETQFESVRRESKLMFQGGNPPEGEVAAPVGSIYQRTGTEGGGIILQENGDAVLQESDDRDTLLRNTCFYVKESGASTSTGWVAK